MLCQLVVTLFFFLISLPFFSVHEIPSILRCYFEIVQASHDTPRWVQCSTPRLFFVWIEMYLFVNTDFILWKLIFAFASLDAISAFLRPSLDNEGPVLKFFNLSIRLSLFPLRKILTCDPYCFD